MELKQSLESHGFVVRCFFPTRFGSIFQVTDSGVLRSTIEGEALFRTDNGDISAVFVPKPQTSEDFKITEHHEDGGYLYTFVGTPRVWEPIGSAALVGTLPEVWQPAFTELR